MNEARAKSAIELSRLYIASAMPALGRLVDFALDHLAVLADELHRQRALAGELEVGGAVLVAEGMAADDDRLGPARHQPRHVLADDRLAEHHAAEDVADGAVRRLPHLLEAEFLHPRLVRGDGGAFDADADLLDGVGGIDRDLVVGLVAVFHPEVEIHQVDIEERVDQLVLDVLPDDPGHLVAIEFDDGVGHLDFCHGRSGLFWSSAFRGGCGRSGQAIAPENAGWKANGRADPAGFQASPKRRSTGFAPCRSAWPDHRGGGAGIPLPWLRRHANRAGRAPAAVRMAELRMRYAHRLGMPGLVAKQRSRIAQGVGLRCRGSTRLRAPGIS